MIVSGCCLLTTDCRLLLFSFHRGISRKLIYKFGWNHESSSLGMVALFVLIIGNGDGNETMLRFERITFDFDLIDEADSRVNETVRKTKGENYDTNKKRIDSGCIS